MLFYNKIYDLHHAVFRMLRIMEGREESIQIEKLRILDFYMAFPGELLEIKSFKGFKSYKKFLEGYHNSYERIINRERLFFKISNIQHSAISELVSYGLFDAEEYKDGSIKRTKKEVSKILQERILSSNDKDEKLMQLIQGPLSIMDLYGDLGLKARTNLIEFRYDSK